MIEFKRIGFEAGSFSLSEISFKVETGTHTVLRAKTGSGKTCLLECLCGLRKVSKGQIWLGNRDVTEEPPASRGIGYVPQDGAIFRTMKIRDQLGFGLRVRGVSQKSAQDRVDEVANLLGITSLLDRYAKGLSGGERQRVALGRAIAIRPKFLCIDEPLSALDEDTRDEMIEVLMAVKQHTRATILHVSHSSYELDRLADATLTISEGRVTPLVKTQSGKTRSES